MAEDRIWLDVPYREKDPAKAAGARWDPAAKRWYAPRPGMTELERWAARPDVPQLLPGEDRGFGSGLFVDLVPSSCWFTNVRYCITERDWERVRRMLLGRAQQRCEACERGEDREIRRWLEAHERWSFDSATRTQKLMRLICLCSDCHRTTHYGLAQVKGQEASAFEHLCAVTGMSVPQAREHVSAAFEVWAQRSRMDWYLDLTMLTNAGITLAKPPKAGSRAGIAESELRARARR
ncbi:DNA primase [Prauserella marina]|uniref:Uncharacterized protein n=1 Tax=Prauserella marina TaxID=530584 RepID=A0A222VIV0_9PSEU|nr:DUF5710 domain-containing protein [Prauserella marina]ASR33859.1 DNA primase [Prauserella marina]PWV82448.1 hypothetical protein DES30_102691 [Prauserella marina]SDC69456.1 hypothetical protein SAMN05421630_103227 [Prauserella marina]